MEENPFIFSLSLLRLQLWSMITISTIKVTNYCYNNKNKTVFKRKREKRIFRAFPHFYYGHFEKKLIT